MSCLPWSNKDMTEKEKIKKWAACWEKAEIMLLKLRQQKLTDISVSDEIISLSDAFESARLHCPRSTTSGLVEQQKHFKRLRPCPPFSSNLLSRGFNCLEGLRKPQQGLGGCWDRDRTTGHCFGLDIYSEAASAIIWNTRKDRYSKTANRIKAKRLREKNFHPSHLSLRYCNFTLSRSVSTKPKSVTISADQWRLVVKDKL